MSIESKKVPLLFTKPWTRPRGGTYNIGERAMFPSDEAKEILGQDCAIVDARPPIPVDKAEERPAKHRMVTAAATIRKQLSEGEA